MKVAGVLFVVAFVACGPSQNLGPPVTCADIVYSNNGTDCGFDEPSACSDGHAYSVDCQDDSTCTCSQDGHPITAIIASNSPSGFCANVTASSLHDLAAKCGWDVSQ